MKKYTIEIIETMSRFIEIEAENENDAIDIVSKKYTNEEIILDSSDYSSTDFIVNSNT